MTCQQMIDFLLDYVDGRLPPEQTQAVQDHVAVCVECDAYLASYRSTVDLVRLMCDDETETPPGMPEDLVTAILEARETELS